MTLTTKQGFPEEGELVMCTVTNVQYHSVFCELDEYKRSGMIHISEVSPGRIRNIRDYVKEGKKVVCKVLRIHEQRNHIDLSLRRVTEAQRRLKVDELKQQQNAEKILEFVAKTLKIDGKKFAQPIVDHTNTTGTTLYSFFQEVVANNKKIDELQLQDKEKKALLEVVLQRVKPPQVEVHGKLELQTYASEGVDVIRKALHDAEKKGKDAVTIRYMGSGSYSISVVSPTYKEAEKILDTVVKTAISAVEKGEGQGKFVRAES